VLEFILTFSKDPSIGESTTDLTQEQIRPPGRRYLQAALPPTSCSAYTTSATTAGSTERDRLQPSILPGVPSNVPTQQSTNNLTPEKVQYLGRHLEVVPPPTSCSATVTAGPTQGELPLSNRTRASAELFSTSTTIFSRFAQSADSYTHQTYAPGSRYLPDRGAHSSRSAPDIQSLPDAQQQGVRAGHGTRDGRVIENTRGVGDGSSTSQTNVAFYSVQPGLVANPPN